MLDGLGEFEEMIKPGKPGEGDRPGWMKFDNPEDAIAALDEINKAKEDGV